MIDSNHETWKFCALWILSQVMQKMDGARKSLPETERPIRNGLVLPDQLSQPLAVHEGPVQPQILSRHLNEAIVILSIITRFILTW